LLEEAIVDYFKVRLIVEAESKELNT